MQYIPNIAIEQVGGGAMTDATAEQIAVFLHAGSRLEGWTATAACSRGRWRRREEGAAGRTRIGTTACMKSIFAKSLQEGSVVSLRTLLHELRLSGASLVPSRRPHHIVHASAQGAETSDPPVGRLTSALCSPNTQNRFFSYCYKHVSSRLSRAA